MTDDADVDAGSAQTEAEGGEQGIRGRSAIRFPYTDIRDAVTIAETIKREFGTECESDQLAGALGQKPTSGSFRTKTATAAVFGAVQTQRGKVWLTDLGHQLADVDTRQRALADAFLNVPLYRAIYDKFKGRALPGGAGLATEIGGMGVLASQVDRARQALLRSAEHAGFFWSGRDRLVLPANSTIGPEDAKSATEPDEGKSPVGTNNPLLKGLWDMLPDGDSFPRERRAQWFRALAINLDLIYGEGNVSISVNQKSAEEPAGPRQSSTSSSDQ